jgi:UDP-glucuronate decarboxylase
MANIVVTGVAGFLGSHLASHHLKRGDFVWGVDNFLSSRDDSEHFKSLMAADNFKMFVGDICSERYDFDAPLARKIDVVYNFACPASPPIYQEFPVQTMMTCTLGTKRVLDIAKRHGAVLVHASTSEVYGDPHVSPQTESYRGNVNPYGPRSCYDEGKRAAEALCFDYLHQYGVDARMVRIFNTYGPRMDPSDGRVVSNFICQALRGENLTVYGDGSQSRSFCYVSDLIRGIVALGSLKDNPCTPINIGNPHEFTINQLADIVMTKIYGSRWSTLYPNAITWKQLPKDDPMQRRPDISLATKLLDWRPTVSLDEGLSCTIDYFNTMIRK